MCGNGCCRGMSEVFDSSTSSRSLRQVSQHVRAYSLVRQWMLWQCDWLKVTRPAEALNSLYLSVL